MNVTTTVITSAENIINLKRSCWLKKIANRTRQPATTKAEPVNMPPPPVTVERSDGQTAFDDVSRPEEQQRQSVTPCRRRRQLRMAFSVSDDQREGPQN